MADEGTRPPSPAAPDPPSAYVADAGPAARGDPPQVEGDAALERERWLRDQIDKERMLLLLFGRHVVHALGHEPPVLRFWRWLIDDVRSERREEAALLAGAEEPGGLARLAVRLQRGWRSLRWRSLRWRRIVNG